MSDGKASTYEVVSVEELRRRALQAARDRHDRALSRYNDLMSEVEAADAAYGSLGIRTTRALPNLSSDSDVVGAATDTLEGQLASQLRIFTRSVCERRESKLRDMTAALLEAARPPNQLEPLQVRQAAKTAASATAVKALEIAARLPGDASTECTERCSRLVAEITQTTNEQRRDTLLSAMRETVQAEVQRVQNRRRNRAAVEEMYGLLDGLGGEPIERLRGLLRGLPVDKDLPADLRSRVVAARQEAVLAADREFALAAASAALSSEGYRLGEDFVTIVATPDGALVPLDTSPRHAVRIRERDGQLLFNVVRFDEQGNTDPPSDGAAAESFCTSYDRVMSKLATMGVASKHELRYAAGSSHLEVRRQTSPFSRATDEQDRQAALRKRGQ